MDILTFALTVITFAYLFLFIFHKGKYSVRYFEYLGVVVFSTVGTVLGIDSDYSPIISIFCGIVTALGGGTIRDIVLFNQKPTWAIHHSIDFLIAVTSGITMWIGRTYFAKSILPGFGEGRETPATTTSKIPE